MLELVSSNYNLQLNLFYHTLLVVIMGIYLYIYISIYDSAGIFLSMNKYHDRSYRKNPQKPLNCLE